MGRKWNPGEIPDSAVIAEGDYIAEIEELDDTELTSTNKYMVKAVLRIKEGRSAVGFPYYHNFVVGSDDDLEAKDPATWSASVGARMLKAMMKKAGVPLGDDLDECLYASIGQRVGIVVNRTIDDGKRDPRYKGRERNEVATFFAPGEREVTGPPPSRAATQPARPPATALARPPATGTGPSAATQPASERKRAAATPSESLKCGICGTMVERRKYPEHVTSCGVEDE